MEPFMKRYTTAKITVELHEDVQSLLWSLLDTFFLTENVKSDYLQIFDLSSVWRGGELLQKVIHRQEVPLWEREEGFFSVGIPHDGTIWINLESEIQIMMFPEDW